MSKSFLVLFLKKELLALPYVSQPQRRLVQYRNESISSMQRIDGARSLAARNDTRITRMRSPWWPVPVPVQAAYEQQMNGTPQLAASLRPVRS
jgi:hypothetical protein